MTGRLFFTKKIKIKSTAKQFPTIVKSYSSTESYVLTRLMKSISFEQKSSIKPAINILSRQ